MCRSILRSTRASRRRRWRWGASSSSPPARSTRSTERTGSYGINRAWENWCGRAGREMQPEQASGLPATISPPRRLCRHAGEVCYRRCIQRGRPRGKRCRAGRSAGIRGRNSIMAAVTVPSERVDLTAAKAAKPEPDPGGRRYRQAVRDAGRRAHRGRSRLARRSCRASSSAVIGPSGCGKSTLFNVIGGLLDGYEGTVKVAGEHGARPARLDRHDLPGGIDLPLAHRDRQCRVPAGDRRHGEVGALRPRPALRRSGRARWLRAALSGGAVRRHAPAGVDGAHARRRAEDPADGRAVRRARRADPAAARRQGAADPAGAAADHPAHHPQHHRGGAALRPHPGDDLPARPDQAHRRDRPAAAAHLRDRVERGVRSLRRANLVRPARGGHQGPARGGERRSCARATSDERRGRRAVEEPLRAGRARRALAAWSRCCSSNC